MTERPGEPIELITREHAIAAARNAVRQQGYAVAVHGSQIRDLDLIAVPWTEETPHTPLTVAEMIAAAIPGVIQGKPTMKPHGRVGFMIYPRFRYGFDRWYIDLSVMPRRRRRTDVDDPLRGRTPLVRTIVETTADYYMVSVQDLVGPRRLPSLVEARSAAMLLVRRLDGRSLSLIGDVFGGRDHSTVWHALRRARVSEDLESVVGSAVSRLRGGAGR